MQRIYKIFSQRQNFDYNRRPGRCKSAIMFSLRYSKILFAVLYCRLSCAFTFPHRSIFGSVVQSYQICQYKHATTLVMRDASCAYWFKTGDRVKVVENVMKAGQNLKGKFGSVTEVRIRRKKISCLVACQCVLYSCWCSLPKSIFMHEDMGKV